VAANRTELDLLLLEAGVPLAALEAAGSQADLQWLLTRPKYGFVWQDGVVYQRGGSGNVIDGCSKVGEHEMSGCLGCYAAISDENKGRVAVPGWHAKDAAQNIKLRPRMLDELLAWQRRLEKVDQTRRVFLDSMSDLGHTQIDSLDPDYRQRTLEVISRCDRIEAWIFTKRPGTLAAVKGYPKNVVLGTSVASWLDLRRLHTLARVSQANPDIPLVASLEPAVGPMGTLPWLELPQYRMAIFGGESGSHIRPLRLEWAEDVRRQTLAAQAQTGIALFEKQTSAHPNEVRLLLGGCYYWQWPGELYPAIQASAETAARTARLQHLLSDDDLRAMISRYPDMPELAYHWSEAAAL